VAAAYYLASKVSGQPVRSYPLGMIGFWSLAVVGPWAGMEKLAGAPIPGFLPYLGAAATVLAAIPIVTVAANVLGTIAGHRETVASSPTLRFTVAGTIGLLLLGIAGICLSLPGSTLRLAQFSVAGYGREVFGLYGFFSLVMFGAMYFIVPRVTRREWLSRRMIRTHFWFSVYGSAALVVFGVLGGLMHGAAQEDWREPWENAVSFVRPYAVGITFTWALLVFANFFFFVHLTLMWLRLGRRSSHPTLLISYHNDHGPHGPEGDIDNVGTTAAH
jgi:cytochrome c oxidase cbb3-type subunit 1